MKVADLQEELNKRKDTTAGLKSVLLDRMNETLSKQSPVNHDRTTTTEKKSSSPKKTTGVYSITEDSWWKVLDTSTIMENPTDPTFKPTRAQTVAEEESKYVPQK